jgi:hypothetical protein
VIEMRNDPRPLISVQQHSTAIRAQYPSDVVNRRLRIAEMLYHPLAPDEIDARVVERQRAGQSIDERNIRYAVSSARLAAMARRRALGSTPVTQPDGPSVAASAATSPARRLLIVPVPLPRRDHDLDISRLAACRSSTGRVRTKAMLNSTGAAINTSQVRPIAATSNR